MMKTEHRRKRRGLAHVLRNIYLPNRNKNVYGIRAHPEVRWSLTHKKFSDHKHGFAANLFFSTIFDNFQDLNVFLKIYT